MAATFAWTESNGAGQTMTNPISNVNFGNTDSPNLAAPNNRVVAGQNSFEKWVRGHFSGTYTSISNLKFFKSAGTLPAEVSIKAAVNATYATPTSSTSVVATSNVPTTLGTALAPNSPGASPAFSGYITMQLQALVSADPGALATQTFLLQYDEV